MVFGSRCSGFKWVHSKINMLFISLLSFPSRSHSQQWPGSMEPDGTRMCHFLFLVFLWGACLHILLLLLLSLYCRVIFSSLSNPERHVCLPVAQEASRTNRQCAKLLHPSGITQPCIDKMSRCGVPETKRTLMHTHLPPYSCREHQSALRTIKGRTLPFNNYG